MSLREGEAIRDQVPAAVQPGDGRGPMGSILAAMVHIVRPWLALLVSVF